MFVPVAIILVFMISLVTIIISRKKYLYNNNNNNNPPGPGGLPLIGNLLQFDKSRPHIYLWRLYQEYGPLVYLKHGVTPILVVNTAKMAKEILKTQDLSFCSRPPVVGQQKLSYGGLDMAFSPYNHHWREIRKICVLHLLSPKRVLTFRPIREDEVRRMINKISRLSSSPVNLSDIAMSLASNLICRVAFGRRYDDDEYEKIRFDRLIMEAQSLMVSFYFSDHFPMFGWLDKLSGILGRVHKNCKELDVFYQQLIDDHLNPKQDRQEDIIDLMIQLKHTNSPSSSLDLTWDHIKALLMDLFVAGTDTVAAAVVWTMTALMQRPEIMKRTQTEIRGIIGNKGTVDEDDLQKLPYLKAVVLESLRLYPPAPLIFRTQILEKKCSIEGYEVEPGTSVFINGWAIARDPDTWEDPNTFLPERFMNMGNVFDNINFEMIPFGGGRRGCPGMGMGLISIELALANLVYCFDWALPLGTTNIDIDALPGLTMHKKNALLLLPTKYTDN